MLLAQYKTFNWQATYCELCRLSGRQCGPRLHASAAVSTNQTNNIHTARRTLTRTESHVVLTCFQTLSTSWAVTILGRGRFKTFKQKFYQMTLSASRARTTSTVSTSDNATANQSINPGLIKWPSNTNYC